MNDRHSTWLRRRWLPRDLSDFEIEALFTLTGKARPVIEERLAPPSRSLWRC